MTTWAALYARYGAEYDEPCDTLDIATALNQYRDYIAATQTATVETPAEARRRAAKARDGRGTKGARVRYFVIDEACAANDEPRPQTDLRAALDEAFALARGDITPPPPPDEPFGLTLERTGFGGIRYYPYDCYETGHRRWHIYPAARNP